MTTQTPPTAPATDNLNNEPNNAIIDSDEASNENAAGSTAEDTFSRMFEQQQEQIAQLIEQNNSLQNQIGLLLRNGASVTDEPRNEPDEPQIGNLTQAQFEYKQSEDYVSLSDLGKEVGKRDYQNINIE